MTIRHLALIAVLVLPLSACQTETQTEVGPTGDVHRETEVGLTPGTAAAIDDAGDGIQAGIDTAGAAVRRGGRAVLDGAERVGDRIEDGVTAGDSAGRNR